MLNFKFFKKKKTYFLVLRIVRATAYSYQQQLQKLHDGAMTLLRDIFTHMTLAS